MFSPVRSKPFLGSPHADDPARVAEGSKRRRIISQESAASDAAAFTSPTRPQALPGAGAMTAGFSPLEEMDLLDDFPARMVTAAAAVFGSPAREAAAAAGGFFGSPPRTAAAGAGFSSPARGGAAAAGGFGSPPRTAAAGAGFGSPARGGAAAAADFGGPSRAAPPAIRSKYFSSTYGQICTSLLGKGISIDGTLRTLSFLGKGEYFNVYRAVGTEWVVKIPHFENKVTPNAYQKLIAMHRPDTYTALFVGAPVAAVKEVTEHYIVQRFVKGHQATEIVGENIHCLAQLVAAACKNKRPVDVNVGNLLIENGLLVCIDPIPPLDQEEPLDFLSLLEGLFLRVRITDAAKRAVLAPLAAWPEAIEAIRLAEASPLLPFIT